MKSRTVRSLAFSLLILLFLSINWSGNQFASQMNWPIWLDSVGTVLCAYFFGPVCGMITGGTYNLLLAVIDEVPWYYAFVSILIALVVGVAARRKKLETLLDTLTTSAMVAATVTVAAYPINLLKETPSTGNEWGDAVMGFLEEIGIPSWIGVLIGDLYVELPDKLLILVVMYLIVHLGRLILKIIRSRKKSDKEDGSGITVQAASILLAAVLGISSFSGWNGSVRAEESGSVSAEQAAEEKTAGKTEFNDYIKTIYSTSNGLHSGKANDIAMTHDGVLWIGTYAGLYRYNGREFRRMSDFESVRNVNCLYADEEGRLWIGTNDNGLSIMINERIVNVIDHDRGLPSNSVKSIIKSADGYYYIGTAEGMQVLTLNTGLKRVGNIPEVFNAIHLAADRNGNVAAITESGTLYLLRQGKVVNSRHREKGKPYFNTCAFEPDGSLLAATQGNNIYHFRIDGDSFTELGFRDCEGLENIKTLMRLPTGELFICADNGIAYTDSEDACGYRHTNTITDSIGKINSIIASDYPELNKILNAFSKKDQDRYERIIINGFNNSIDNMLVDYQGNLWFTSSRLGLLRMAPSEFRDLNSGITGMENHVVNVVAQWNGIYYFGTDDGMIAVDAEGKRRITGNDDILASFPDCRIRCMMADGDKLWVGTYNSANGLVEIEPDGTKYYYNDDNGTFENKARVITRLKDGTVAAGGNKKLIFIRDHQVEDTLETGAILTIAEMKDGTILAGTDGEGLIVIGDRTVKQVLTRRDGLSSEVILRIVPDPVPENGGAFIVTSNGLCYLDSEWKARRLSNFPYYNNYDIWMKDDHTLFVLSSGGIYIVNREELLSGNGNLSYDLLDVRRGMNGSITPNSWTWYDAEKQALYLPCDTGVYVLNTGAISGGKQYYRMNVSGIKAGNTIYRAERNAVTRIPRQESRIEFLPEVINYSVQDPNVGYMLEGFDSDWTIVPQNALGSIAYSNLPTGDYVFHLAVLDNQNNIISERTYPVTRVREMYDNDWFIFYILSVPMFAVFWVTWLLLKRHEEKVKAQLAEANRQVEMGKQTVRAIANAVDAKDERTGGHSSRVALYSKQIAERYGLDEKQCREVEWAAQLHDIGKIAIPDNILNKDSRLNDTEYAIMKSHTLKGAEILRDFTLLDHVTEGAMYHHERPDGRGYPQGLKGEDIPLYARIIGVADAFDAMTANRVYRKQMDFGYVLGELEKGRGTQFAPEFVDILLNLIRTNVIDLNELYGIKPEDTAQAEESGKTMEAGAEKTTETPENTGSVPATGEGGKS